MTRENKRAEIVKIGGELMIRGGFAKTGIEAVLKKARVPKGSFYYYFPSKEDFGLAVIDDVAEQMFGPLEACMSDASVRPLARIRNYLEAGLAAVDGKCCKQGCLLGDLGQELAHQNEKFRHRLEEVFSRWKACLAGCLAEARKRKELSAKADPEKLAGFILSGWEGAILRSKVARSVEPMKQFIDVLFGQVLVR